MKSCPACKKSVDAAATDCHWCGIVFAKWGQPRNVPTPPPPVSAKKSGLNIISLLIVPAVLVGGAFLFIKKRSGSDMIEERTKANVETIERLQNVIGLTSSGMFNPKDFLDYVRSGDLVAVQRYLSAGMSPDTSFGGEPALIAALGEGQWDVARALLQAGANPNEQDKRRGYTPLMVALNPKAPQAREFVAALLSKGADVRILNGNGQDARQIAEAVGMSDVLKNAPVVASASAGGALTRERVIELMNQARSGNTAAMDQLRRSGEPAIKLVFQLLDDPSNAKNSLYVLGQFTELPTQTHFAMDRMLRDPKSKVPKRELAEIWMKAAKTDYSKTMMFEKLLEVDDFGNQTKIYAINGLREVGPAAEHALPALRELLLNKDLRAMAESAINSIQQP